VDLSLDNEGGAKWKGGVKIQFAESEEKKHNEESLQCPSLLFERCFSRNRRGNPRKTKRRTPFHRKGERRQIQ